MTVNLRGVEHKIRLPLEKPPAVVLVNKHPSDRGNDNRSQRYGWIASAAFHACGLAAVLWWPGTAIQQPANISGRRSVASIQLAFSAAAIAGEPEPLEVLETALTEVSPPKTEIIELLSELETEEVVIVEEPSLSDSSEQPAEEAAEKPVEQETTTQQGTAAVNSLASQSSVAKHLGFDDTSPARPIRNPLPVYPAEAVSSGRAGRVMLRLTISSQGHVTDLAIATSSGHSALDEAALTAIRNWRFEPARRDGQAVEWTTLLPVRFRMN